MNNGSNSVECTLVWVLSYWICFSFSLSFSLFVRKTDEHTYISMNMQHPLKYNHPLSGCDGLFFFLFLSFFLLTWNHNIECQLRNLLCILWDVVFIWYTQRLRKVAKMMLLLLFFILVPNRIILTHPKTIGYECES